VKEGKKCIYIVGKGGAIMKSPNAILYNAALDIGVKPSFIIIEEDAPKYSKPSTYTLANLTKKMAETLATFVKEDLPKDFTVRVQKQTGGRWDSYVGSWEVVVKRVKKSSRR